MWASAPPIRFPGPWKETCWSFNIRGFIGYLNGGHGISFSGGIVFGLDVRSCLVCVNGGGHTILIEFAG